MRLTHAREVEVFVELDAEKKTRCLRLEKGDLKSDQDLASSDRRCHYIDIVTKIYIRIQQKWLVLSARRSTGQNSRFISMLQVLSRPHPQHTPNAITMTYSKVRVFSLR
jgi:hypothetical protein